MADDVIRKRPPSQEDIDRIPEFIKKPLSQDSIFQLASVVKDYQEMDKPIMGEVAYSGLSRITGYTSAFNFYHGYGYYDGSDIPLNVLDAMRRDSTVALGLAIVKYPIVNLGFTINCQNDVIKDFVTTVIKPIWKKALRDSLLSFDYGYSPFEKVWVNRKLDIDPGKNQRKIIGKNFIVLDKLKPLPPKTVTITVDDFGNFKGLKQQSFGKELITLNNQKSMVITYNEEYNNYFGKSRLIPAYPNWYWKMISNQFFLRWMERHSIPPIIVRYPKGKTTTSYGELDNSEIALKLAQAYASYGNITLPSDRHKDGDYPLWSIETPQQPRQNLTIDKISSVWDKEILRGILIPDKESLGVLNPDTAGEIFLSTLGQAVGEIEDKFNKEIIEPLVHWNFSREEREECTLNIDDIDFQKRQEMRKLLSKMLDMNNTYIKNFGGTPFDVLPDMKKINEILDIPSVKSSVYIPVIFGPDGKEIKRTDKEVKDGLNSGKSKGPDKGDQNPSNMATKSRNGNPRDEDKDDVSGKDA